MKGLRCMRQAGPSTRMMRCGNAWSKPSSQEIQNQQDAYERGGMPWSNTSFF